MGFLVTNYGTFLDFDSAKVPSLSLNCILFMEGKKDVVNVLVNQQRERLNTAVSKHCSRPLQIVTFHEVITRDSFREQIKYYFPYLQQDSTLETEEKLKQLFWERLDLDGRFPNRGVFLWFGETIETFFPVLPNIEAVEFGLEKLGTRIEESGNSVRYSLFESIIESWAAEPADKADREFTDDIDQVLDEVKERISRLRAYGVDEVVIRSLFQQPVKLSRLVVTKDYRILLPDYELEIEMEPLPKAIYFLFLRHPEGLVFKHLRDCRQELMHIYKSITRRENMDAVQASIDRVLDPADNSINEKCSRIKSAFVAKFDEDIAENYYITTQSEVCYDVAPNQYYRWLNCKGISLDRELVTFECEF